MPIQYVALLGDVKQAPLVFYKGFEQGAIIETKELTEAKQFRTVKDVKAFFKWLESRNVVIKPYQLEKLDWPRNHKDGKIHFVNREIEGLYYSG